MNLKKDCFNSIDELPIWNWRQVSETGDLTYLFKGKEGKVKPEMYGLWLDLQQEYFDTYGISKGLQEVLKLQKQWILLRCDYLVNEDRFKKMQSDMIQIDMDDAKDGEGQMTTKDTIIFLEEKLGRELDTKKISVRKYYDYIDYYKKR